MKIIVLSLIVLILITVFERWDITKQLEKGKVHPEHKSFWMKEE